MRILCLPGGFVAHHVRNHLMTCRFGVRVCVCVCCVQDGEEGWVME